MSQLMSERARDWDSIAFWIIFPPSGYLCDEFWPKKKSHTSVIWNVTNSQAKLPETEYNLYFFFFFPVWYSSFLLLHTTVGDTIMGITCLSLAKPICCNGLLFTKFMHMSEKQWATHFYVESWFRLIIHDLNQGVQGEHTAKMISTAYLDRPVSLMAELGSYIQFSHTKNKMMVFKTE